MKRLVYLLAAIGIALVVVAVRVYGEARQRYDLRSTLCDISGDCTAAMSWQPAALIAVLAALAIGAASVVSKRTQ